MYKQGTCSATGDPHYRTFDSKTYSFMGHCRYIFARDCRSNNFSIEVQNTPCGTGGTVTCTKTVYLYINESSIVFLRGGAVELNGQEISLPYFAPGIAITRIAFGMLRLRSNIGLDVQWDTFTRLYVTVQPQYANSTCGLCGNYNGNQGDDFMNNDGAIETNVVAFGNSWVARWCNKTATSMVDTCEIMVQRFSIAESKCKVLKQKPFRVCHQSVDPEDQYIQNCKFDLCGCRDGTQCYCDAIADYAHACLRYGHVINWRNTGLLPECDVKCDNSEQKYQHCGTSCTGTCRELQLNERCIEVCSPGCHCPNGTALNDQKKCVAVSECPCHYENKYYHPGESYWPDRCTKCTCSNGKVQCKNETCQVKCSSGRAWSQCAQCEKTCGNVHMKCLNKQCEEGCLCPHSLVFNGTQCVNVSECPCHYNNLKYSHGQTIHTDCNTCVCSDNKWICTKKKCPRVCSAVGDPHYKTFDGKKYDFQGSCRYILSEDYCGKKWGKYRIEIQNVPCGTSGVTCTKAPIVTINNTVITFYKHKKPRINTLPGAINSHLNGGYKIYHSWFFTVLTTDFGLVVEWDYGTRVYVNLLPTYQGKMCNPL
ncbi:von Willebrand factor-like [Xenia sp. Carnegie-2017]|uniref:von Willebrand factor-like n=1 Tax=Xenia sp. Carnegie-2017 TaxID=2897299 RepID=UPI001F048EC2|nr:von Willebrand factor-like [Xenia sp. Carnegie-2017]